MPNPTVSFVIPCYKLAHLLRDCIDSILSQTYIDFEVLVMDDCSPDDTALVAQSICDPRVKYIRNDQNLGHLRNYNKGIRLSGGRYVWLISADDRLRVPYVLERYVHFMDAHPNAGYIFCPAVGLQDGVETQLLDWGYFGAADQIFDGRKFITTLLGKSLGLAAPAVMVRRDCYEKVSMFPTDMPHQGDLYIWFLWALEYDVAYLAEPMVNYRAHDLNIMKDLIRRVPEAVFSDEVNVLWRVKRRAEQKGFLALAHRLEYFIGSKYARAAAFALYGEKCSHWAMSLKQCNDALSTNTIGESDYKRIRARLRAYLANKHWRHGAFGDARRTYVQALRDDWRMPQVWLRLLMLLLGMGRAGMLLRSRASAGQSETFVPNA
jgi:glycosyltransferase involved in cell wall biosynthesis